MKIDLKDVLKNIPGSTTDKKDTPNPTSVLKGVADFARDKFETSTSTTSLAPKLLMTAEQPDLNGLKDLDVFGIQDQLTKARMGADMVSKSSKNGDAVGKDIWSKSDKAKEKESKSAGTNDELKKKYSNVMGQLDWNKGTTLFDVDGAVFRHPIDRKLKDEKAGKASATGRLDILSGRLRGFGIADFKAETLTAQLGLGLQGSLEAIGFHLQLKHDAPSVKFFGRDASLHSIINVDAYVGVIAEAEATLNLDPTKGDGFLRLGGQAYAAATASIAGRTSLGKFASVHGQGNAYAGVGAGAGLDIGFKDGAFDFSYGVGASILYGYGYKVGFSVNVVEIEKLGENMVKDAASRPVVWAWEKNFPWPWKPEFVEVVQAPGDFLQDVGHVLGVNGGSLMRLLDLAFGITRKSDTSSKSEEYSPDKTEELSEKPNRNTQTVA